MIQVIRYSSHLFIFILLFTIYSIFIFDDFVLTNFLQVNSIVGIFISISIIVEFRTVSLLEKLHFSVFSTKHIQIILNKISIFFKWRYLWFLLAVPPLMLFFIESLSVIDKIYLIGRTILQNLLTVYLIFTLADLANFFGYSKHFSAIPAMITVIAIFARSEGLNIFFVLNPFGGLSLYKFDNPLYFIYSILLLALLYLINSYILKKYWLTIK